MEEISRHQSILTEIKTQEGEYFECDEEAVEQAYQQDNSKQSSLAIRILSILGGFFATLAFLGFLALAGLYKSEVGMLLFGAGFIIAALLLNKLFDTLITDTFSISIFVSGFALMGWGLSQIDIEENTIFCLFIILAALTVFLTNNFMLNFLSILLISGSLISLMLSNNYYDLVHLYNTVYTIALSYLFFNEAKFIEQNNKLTRLYYPMRIGLIFSLLFGLIITGKRGVIPISENHVWLSSIVMIAVVLYLIKSIMEVYEVSNRKSLVLILTLCALILLPTVFSPAIAGSMVILLMSFRVQYKTGMAIGVISLIYFISQYYYDLNFTLLTKSMLLVTSGLLFLLLYFLIAKKFDLDEKV